MESRRRFHVWAKMNALAHRAAEGAGRACGFVSLPGGRGRSGQPRAACTSPGGQTLQLGAPRGTGNSAASTGSAPGRPATAELRAAPGLGPAAPRAAARSWNYDLGPPNPGRGAEGPGRLPRAQRSAF